MELTNANDTLDNKKIQLTNDTNSELLQKSIMSVSAHDIYARDSCLKAPPKKGVQFPSSTPCASLPGGEEEENDGISNEMPPLIDVISNNMKEYNADLEEEQLPPLIDIEEENDGISNEMPPLIDVISNNIKEYNTHFKEEQLPPLIDIDDALPELIDANGPPIAPPSSLVIPPLIDICAPIHAPSRDMNEMKNEMDIDTNELLTRIQISCDADELICDGHSLKLPLKKHSLDFLEDTRVISIISDLISLRNNNNINNHNFASLPYISVALHNVFVKVKMVSVTSSPQQVVPTKQQQQQVVPTKQQQQQVVPTKQQQQQVVPTKQQEQQVVPMKQQQQPLLTVINDKIVMQNKNITQMSHASHDFSQEELSSYCMQWSLHFCRTRQQKLLNQLDKLKEHTSKNFYLNNNSDHRINEDNYNADSKITYRLAKLCNELNLTHLTRFQRVSSDYYSWTLDQRRLVLNAPTTSYLCKSILTVNSKCTSNTIDDKENSKYYLVIIQYTSKLNAEKLLSFVRGLKQQPISRKYFSFRLAPEDVSDTLTGFGHNAVAPIGLAQDIPVILSHTIKELEFFWIGGGEVDVKLRVSTSHFIDAVHPFIGDVTFDSSRNNFEDDFKRTDWD